MPGVMTVFNQGPGRNPHFDPTEGMELVWLGGSPVLKNDVDEMQGQQESQADSWKNWKSGAWKAAWMDPYNKEQWRYHNKQECA
eukprot:12306137-Prorocentrum_lima.AAC.1